MNYQSARVFLSIVEHQSISAAAHALYLSQPTVSAYLSRLEDELGSQLFLRQRGVQKITLTPTGHRLIPIAEEFLSTEQHLQEFKASLRQNSLRIGAARNPYEYMGTPIVDKLRQKLPKFDVKLYTIPSETDACPQPLDVVLRLYQVSTPASTSSFTHIPFFLDQQYVLCPADTPLPNRTLSPEDLDPVFQIRQAIMNEKTARWYQQYFPDSAISRYPLVMDFTNLCRDFKDPRCWAFVHASTAEHLMSKHPDELTYRRIVPTPPPRTGNIFIAKTYSRPDVIKTFLSCCREYLEDRPLIESQLPDNMYDALSG